MVDFFLLVQLSSLALSTSVSMTFYCNLCGTGLQVLLFLLSDRKAY